MFRQLFATISQSYQSKCRTRLFVVDVTKNARGEHASAVTRFPVTAVTLVMSATPGMRTQSPTGWQSCSMSLRSAVDTPTRRSCFKKWIRLQALDNMADTRTSHFNFQRLCNIYSKQFIWLHFQWYIPTSVSSWYGYFLVPPPSRISLVFWR